MPLFGNGFSAITSLFFAVDSILESVSFSTCLHAHFQFSWSRDHFSAPSRGRPISAKCLVTDYSKRHIFSLGFLSIPLVYDKTVSCRLCAVEAGYPKTRKMMFRDLAPPMLKNSRIFHDSTRPHLHFDGLPPKSRRSVVSI